MYSAPDVWHGLMGRLADHHRRRSCGRRSTRAWTRCSCSTPGRARSPSATTGEFVLPHSARVLDALADAGVPRIHFGVGTGELLGAMAEAGADVVGVDWRMPLDEAARRAGRTPVQGNLDPAVLFADRASIEARGAPDPRRGHAARPATCSTSATACCPTPTRTCSPGWSSWCTARSGDRARSPSSAAGSPGSGRRAPAARPARAPTARSRSWSSATASAACCARSTSPGCRTTSAPRRSSPGAPRCPPCWTSSV